MENGTTYVAVSDQSQNNADASSLAETSFERAGTVVTKKSAYLMGLTQEFEIIDPKSLESRKGKMLLDIDNILEQIEIASVVNSKWLVYRPLPLVDGTVVQDGMVSVVPHVDRIALKYSHSTGVPKAIGTKFMSVDDLPSHLKEFRSLIVGGALDDEIKNATRSNPEDKKSKTTPAAAKQKSRCRYK